MTGHDLTGQNITDATRRDRTEPDGTIVFQATSFPMGMVNVELNPGTDELKLNVVGQHSETHCITDVQALQAELARNGLQLAITDWGKGKPGYTERRVEQENTT